MSVDVDRRDEHVAWALILLGVAMVVAGGLCFGALFVVGWLWGATWMAYVVKVAARLAKVAPR